MSLPMKVKQEHYSAITELKAATPHMLYRVNKVLKWICHAKTCDKEKCTEHCVNVRGLIAHCMACGLAECKEPTCRVVKWYLHHYETCDESSCPACAFSCRQPFVCVWQPDSVATRMPAYVEGAVKLSETNDALQVAIQQHNNAIDMMWLCLAAEYEEPWAGHGHEMDIKASDMRVDELKKQSEALNAEFHRIAHGMLDLCKTKDALEFHQRIWVHNNFTAIKSSSE